ncbi:hypothetical protein GQ473_00575 [archaeon]|nr:hypothetical protein [archaeon]
MKNRDFGQMQLWSLYFVVIVGGMFFVFGCGMECDEFVALKAYTDCTGVFGEFSRRSSGC